ncbi:MAG: alpha/beta fold hydrolase [Candidatus Marinimicrobia bacterium]|nr:alpha/beta fold hydrolase [Candidatus Neomarinimicrobiota bacterium]
MKKYLLILLFFATALRADETTQRFASIGNLVLESGEIIEDCIIGYRTIGTPNKDSSNVVLFPTWFGGLSEHLVGLIEKYNFINPKKYWILCVDALGNGLSSSPSNYSGNFPEYSIRDMVKAEYLLLTQYLKINHVYAIVGGSMGSFQTFQWIVDHPNFMDKAIPYVCSPRRTASDQMWLMLEKDIISLHQDYQIPEGETQRIMNILTAFFARSQTYLSKNIPSSEFEEYYAQFTAGESKPFTLPNRLSQIKAMLQHDITRQFDGSLEKAAAAVKAQLLIIVSDSDQIVNPIPAIKFAELTGSELIVLSNECGHLAPGCDMESFVGYIAKFLESQGD